MIKVPLAVAICAGLSYAADAELAFGTRLESPTIAKLAAQNKKGDAQALVRFWQEIKDRGAPLVEPVAGDPKHVLLTFLYRAKTPVSSVSLSAQLTTVRAASSLTHLLNTDVWYKTYWLRSDLRFRRLDSQIVGAAEGIQTSARPLGAGVHLAE